MEFAIQHKKLILNNYTNKPVVVMGCRGDTPGLACSGKAGVAREGFSEEVTLELRTKGWVGVHHCSDSKENHVEGHAQTVAFGHCKGQSLKWEGTFTLFLIIPLETVLLLTLLQGEYLVFEMRFLNSKDKGGGGRASRQRR